MARGRIQAPVGEIDLTQPDDQPTIIPWDYIEQIIDAVMDQNPNGLAVISEDGFLAKTLLQSRNHILETGVKPKFICLIMTISDPDHPPSSSTLPN